MHADAADAVNGIVRTLKRSPRGAALRWLLDVPNGADAEILPEYLTELLGNILENATKWANETVSVSVSKGQTILIRVEDDGPGVPEDQLNTLGQRGVRLDEQKQGSGLGLAIARDVSEAYHGKLSFQRSPMGGLAVTVQIPGSQ